MRKLPLSQGLFATLDDSEFDRVSTFKWYAWWDCTAKTHYAVRSVGTGEHKHTVYMHRWILGVSDSSVKVDHRDHDGLNNRRSNLRSSTVSQNAQNSRKAAGCSSKYKGVSFLRKSGKWRAYIKLNQKQVRLGNFDTEKEAAIAYNAAAAELFGEFAFPNQIDSEAQT